ncbi:MULTISPECIES: transposase [unclassified Frankia]|uniref:transposase n=1 Tax=unclassified Frankia TaxID=2632575 RepID=UPI001EE4E412|nr:MULTISPECIES: transposase [unclassified Frankia]
MAPHVGHARRGHGWGAPARPVLAGAAEFGHGLTERGLVYVLGVTHTATTEPATASPVPAYPGPPATLKALVQAVGRGTARHGG